MREDDHQLGWPFRAYRAAKAAIVALALGAGDEGCTAYATDTNEFGTFDGAAWTWSNHALLGPRHSDTAADAPTQGSMIIGNATPAWDELLHPGDANHLQTTAVAVAWSPNITMGSGQWIGDAGDLRIVFDYANGDLILRLGDAAGSDEVQVVDSGGVPVLRIDSNGNVTVAEDTWHGIDAASERFVFNGSAGAIAVMGANLGIGTLAPSYLAHLKGASATLAIEDTTNALAWQLKAATFRLIIDPASGATRNVMFYNSGAGDIRLGIGRIPTCLLEIDTATEALGFVDAGSAGATEQDWIEVKVAGVQGYLRVFAAK